MKEKKITKTINLYESSATQIQKFADNYYDGSFSQAIRKIISVGLEKIESKT